MLHCLMSAKPQHVTVTRDQQTCPSSNVMVFTTHEQVKQQTEWLPEVEQFLDLEVSLELQAFNLE
jgi:hypothetical protein